MYVYQRVVCETTPMWVVGFFRPDGAFISDSDHELREAAARRVHWLNGGNSTMPTAELLEPLITQTGERQRERTMHDWKWRCGDRRMGAERRVAHRQSHDGTMGGIL